MYTHYWQRPRALPPQPWAAFCGDVRAILANLPPTTETAGGYMQNYPLFVCGPDGPIEISNERVWFNGAGPDAMDEDLGHEDFFIDRVCEPPSRQENDAEPLHFQFCKTARKPYDVAVCACLLAFRDHFPETILNSDGDLGEWQQGIELYQQVLQRTPNTDWLVDHGPQS